MCAHTLVAGSPLHSGNRTVQGLPSAYLVILLTGKHVQLYASRMTLENIASSLSRFNGYTPHG